MSQSFTHLLVHAIFATKGREPWLASDIRPRLFGYIHGICRNVDAPLVIAGGVEDHMHLLFEAHPSKAVADAMRDIKANSSRWIHTTFPALAEFAWQAGYAAFSVSWSARDDVRRYIQTQESHHARRTVAEEMREFFARHGLPWDEQRVFV